MVGFIPNRQDSLSAQNTFGQWLNLSQGGIITISGTWVGTISLQRRGADGNTNDVTDNSGNAITFTKNGTYSINPYLLHGDYRWGFKTGNYTSGTAAGTIEGV